MTALETYLPLAEFVVFFAGWSSGILTGILGAIARG